MKYQTLLLAVLALLTINAEAIRYKEYSTAVYECKRDPTCDLSALEQQMAEKGQQQQKGGQSTKGYANDPDKAKKGAPSKGGDPNKVRSQEGTKSTMSADQAQKNKKSTGLYDKTNRQISDQSRLSGIKKQLEENDYNGISKKKVSAADMKSMEEDPGLRQLKDYLSDFVVSNIDNSDVRTAYDWLGDRATLVVNVASECGLTDQSYRELVDFKAKYGDQGLEILAFPCNQFGAQEPGSHSDILEFATSNYQVNFPLMEKTDVNGDETHPLYKFMKQNSSIKGSDIEWNFTYFLLDRFGRVQDVVGPKQSVSMIDMKVQAMLDKQPR